MLNTASTKGFPVIIWRRHGWLVLPFFLFAWAYTDGLGANFYRDLTGKADLSNQDKAVVWGLALLLTAVLLFGLNFVLLRGEGKKFTPEQWEEEVAQWNAGKDKKIADYVAIKIPNETPEAYETRNARYAQIIAASKPPTPPSTSSFFFIPMKFMPLVFGGIALLLLALNLPAALASA